MITTSQLQGVCVVSNLTEYFKKKENSLFGVCSPKKPSTERTKTALLLHWHKLQLHVFRSGKSRRFWKKKNEPGAFSNQGQHSFRSFRYSWYFLIFRWWKESYSNLSKGFVFFSELITSFRFLRCFFVCEIFKIVKTLKTKYSTLKPFTTFQQNP